MCFNARYLLEIALKRAIRNNNHGEIAHWEEELSEYNEAFQVSGFAHPKIIIYTNREPYRPRLSVWGLVPHWAKTPESIWNKTINARGETIFEKPAFKKSANEKRCLIPAEGFYDYYYFRGKSYPFYIYHKEKKPLLFAGLWDEWTDRGTGEILNSFSIVTTKANSLMAKIHNRPKLSNDARMPVILPENMADEWLNPLSREELQKLIKPFPDSELTAHTVKKLLGKDSPGNVREANKKYNYKELEFQNKIDEVV